MRKLIVCILILAGSHSLAAQSYRSFDLDAFIAEHPTGASYDPITRCFLNSTVIPDEIASIGQKIMEIEQKLSDLAVLQRANAEKLLEAKDSNAEADGWQKNLVLARQEKDLKSHKYELLARQQNLQQLSSRDSGILPDIGNLVNDIRGRFNDPNAIYLNYLPATETQVHKNWLSSPLQIFLWSPHERYIAEYIENSYEISQIFPQCRRPVVFQKSFERKP
ncbi:MAG: hypothetical protein GX569_13625 [Candidatus Riflebacteria bacterium]|nr:hypothetical protein [Candidatus Riflebacteria bacterium]